MKRTRCKGKNGKKGKGEVLDLIVTIDLVSNRNSMGCQGGMKLKSFLHKNQHTQRKLLNFELWINQWYTRSQNIWPKPKVFSFRFWPPKLKAEYDRNSRKALDFLFFVHENIANVNYQW